ncbi:ABC transporter permease [Pikeienuella sp. HZG-20]|uniref:ABC transporter permease n=1 Tax=Paludibacillus litoralis TaxID=3133267 RepID=UPI0030ED0F99
MATLRQTIGGSPDRRVSGGSAKHTVRAWLGSVDPLGLVGVILAVFLWWGLGFVVGSAVLPSPYAVMARVAEDFWLAPMLSYYGLPKTGLFDSLIYSATNVFVSVLLGGAIGAVLGLFTARVMLARAILDPILTTVGTIPILVLAPFFLIWFGTGRWSALLLITIYVVVILYIYAQRAADNLDPVYEDSARTLGAGGWDILWGMLVPGTLPQILGGLRIALAGAWGLEAIAELLGAQQGIGKIIEVLAGSLDTEGIFACLLVLGVAAVISDMLMGALARRAMRWSADAK